MKEGGTSLNKTFREYNLVFKGLNKSVFIFLYHQSFYCEFVFVRYIFFELISLFARYPFSVDVILFLFFFFVLGKQPIDRTMASCVTHSSG